MKEVGRGRDFLGIFLEWEGFDFVFLFIVFVFIES